MIDVVAAAIVRGGRVLAARRTSPPEAAGRWELPGGKVEPGETREAALVRELGEELGIVAEVTGWLDGESRIGETHTLVAGLVRISAGEPRPREHDALRWLAPEELDEIDWLEPDLPFVAQLRERLSAPRSAQVAVFFDEEAAVSVARRLDADGWWTDVRRQRFQGEDDDEDHPWAVASDAPLPVLELLVEEYDGWLDRLEETTAPPPLDLPAAPRRIKRPPLDSPHA